MFDRLGWWLLNLRCRGRKITFVADHEHLYDMIRGGAPEGLLATERLLPGLVVLQGRVASRQLDLLNRRDSLFIDRRREGGSIHAVVVADEGATWCWGWDTEDAAALHATALLRRSAA